MTMENPFKLDYSTYSKIRNILENPSTMQSFLEVLPPDCTTEDVLNSMDIASRQYNMTPAKYLLQCVLAPKNFEVSQLIEWFEAINLEKALVHLKKQDTLSIIEHPCEHVRIDVGEELLLTCCATPSPEYQWFRFDEELLLQVEPVLSIKNARAEDSGQYTCLVTKFNTQKNAWDYLYSNTSHVEVTPSDLHAPPSLYHEPGLSTPNFMLSRKNSLKETSRIQDEKPSSQAGSTSLLSNLVLNNQKNVLTKRERIVIIKHPFAGKVAQGLSISLILEAVCSLPLSYQWYKNGRLLPDEKSNRLDLKSLYPDPETGETEWEYQCEVSNEYEKVLSRSAVVELDEVNDTTPFIAQEKIAFMVANDTYDNLEHLLKPAADVTVVAKILSSMGFKILAFRNLTFTEMRNAFEFFCRMLKPGSYALFFFSGHGFELYGQTYLQPVDCSENLLPQESICSEYILECLQKTKPAMNILLIDACRKLPGIVSSGGASKSQDILPGKIFQAKMKYNTIYGYSTSFLCAAHENDHEDNSVFVKYLKKYLTLDKSIREVLTMVQDDCAKDPLTKDLQNPTIKSTLALKRKLNDPLPEGSTTLNTPSTLLNWCDIKREVTTFAFNLPKLDAAIILEFRHHREVFCNGIDVFVYLYVKPNPNLFILKDVEMNTTFKSPVLSVLPTKGFHLKNVSLQIETKNLLFKKEVQNVQKINDQQLEGEVSLRFCSKNSVQSKQFSMNNAISELQLSVNHLQSNNVEEQNCRVVQNVQK